METLAIWNGAQLTKLVPNGWIQSALIAQLTEPASKQSQRLAASKPNA